MEPGFFNLQVPVIDGRTSQWKKAVGALLELKKNFFLILHNDLSERDALRLTVNYLPFPLQKWDLVPAIESITSHDYLRLRDALGHGDHIFQIETLKRPEIHPPATSNFIAYCEIRGIVAETNALDAAKEACQHYIARMRALGIPPSVRVMGWSGFDWRPFKSFATVD